MANMYILIDEKGSEDVGRVRVIAESVDNAISWHKKQFPERTVIEVFERVWTEDDGEEER